jgi:ribosome-associated translation inhibitor RaiA
MQVTVIDRSGHVRAGEDVLARRIRRKLARLEHAIQSVTLFFADVNGPRGGANDQHCTLVLSIPGGREVVVSERDESRQAALARALPRAKRNLLKRLKRRNRRRQSRPLMPAPEVPGTAGA